MLCCVAAVRMCRWVIENPQATIIFCLPPLKFVLWNSILEGRMAKWWMPQHICSVDCALSAWKSCTGNLWILYLLRWMGAYGGYTAKPEVAVGTALLV